MVIVILSQQEGYHIAHADMLRKSILEQADILDKVCTLYYCLILFKCNSQVNLYIRIPLKSYYHMN